MRQMRVIMGMPITIDVVASDSSSVIASAFDYFRTVDERFSTYKDTSEISRINRGELSLDMISEEMHEVFAIAEDTKKDSRGYFDIKRHDGSIDPSGVVKGWAIKNAAALLEKSGATDFFIDAGGDIESAGKNAQGHDWNVGIKNPFKQDEIVKVIYPRGHGVATSGSYIRGAHIYDPHDHTRLLDEIVSITVIGTDVLEADRYATAAFAMQRAGIKFIEQLPGFEGYMIDNGGTATMTSDFEAFTIL